MARIKELEAKAKKPCANCMTLAGLNANQAKTISELTAARDAFEQMYLTAAYGSAALKQEGE